MHRQTPDQRQRRGAEQSLQDGAMLLQRSDHSSILFRRDSLPGEVQKIQHGNFPAAIILHGEAAKACVLPEWVVLITERSSIFIICSYVPGSGSIIRHPDSRRGSGSSSDSSAGGSRTIAGNKIPEERQVLLIMLLSYSCRNRDSSQQIH